MDTKELKRTLYTQASDANINHETDDHRQDTNHYHVPITRMHNAALHGWGAAFGLEVEKTSASQLRVSQGLAIDKSGRMIAMAAIGVDAGQPGEAYIHDVTQEDNLRDVPVLLDTTSTADGTYYLTIELAVTQMVGPDGWTLIPVEGRVVSEGGSDRLISTPLISLRPTSGFPLTDANPNYGVAIVLATVILAGGQVNSLSGADRQRATIAVGELVVEQGDPVGSGNMVQDRARGRIAPLSSGGLKMEVPAVTDQLLFQQKGDANFSDMVLRANHLRLRDNNDRQVMHVNTGSAAMTVGNNGNPGDLKVKDGQGRDAIQFDGRYAALYIGASGNEGDIRVRDNNGSNTFSVDGSSGTVNLKRIDPYGNELHLDARYVRIHGWDLTLDGRSGNNNRALVDLNDKLIINYSNDYGQGVETPGDFRVNGAFNASRHVKISSNWFWANAWNTNNSIYMWVNHQNRKDWNIRTWYSLEELAYDEHGTDEHEGKFKVEKVSEEDTRTRFKLYVKNCHAYITVFAMSIRK